MSTAHASVETRPAWTVSFSSTHVRLLQACVQWLLHAQRDPEIGRQLAEVESRLQAAAPLRPGVRQPHPGGPR
jgi:hypothetical protein